MSLHVVLRDANAAVRAWTNRWLKLAPAGGVRLLTLPRVPACCPPFFRPLDNSAGLRSTVILC